MVDSFIYLAKAYVISVYRQPDSWSLIIPTQLVIPETIWLVHYICLAKSYVVSLHCQPDSWNVIPILVDFSICLANAYVFSKLTC